MKINYIESKNGLTVVTPTDHFRIKSNNRDLIKQIINIIGEYNLTGNEELYETLKCMIVPAKQLLGTSLEEKNGKLYLKGSTLAIPDMLANKINDYFEAEIDINPLVNFWKNCLEHPYPQAILELFEFLSINDMPITPEGNIIGYKKLYYIDESTRDINEFEGLRLDSNGIVRGYKGKFVNKELSDKFLLYLAQGDNVTENLFVDVYSRKIKQGIGDYVTQPMPENWDWDSQKRKQCGVGLHVGSFDYIFRGDVRVLVSVKPQDVIACEAGNRKFRCIGYTNICVIDENKKIEELVLN